MTLALLFFPRLLKACLYDKLNLLLKVCTQYWVSSTSLIDKNIFEFNKKKFIKEKAIRFEIFLIITVVTVSLSQVKITGNENLFSSFLRCHNQRIVILRRSIDHYCHQSPKMTLWWFNHLSPKYLCASFFSSFVWFYLTF